MAATKLGALALVVLFLCISGQYQATSAADTCSTQLASLVACAASVVPGSSVGAPTKQCCSALQSVSSECACNTLKIINSLPTKCGQSAVKCSS
ncbi:protein YY1-like [Carex rostrata]